MAEKKSNKPYMKFKVGGLNATVWRNKSEKGNAYYSINLTCSYKDKDGEWQEGDSLAVAHLPVAARLCNKIFDALTAQVEEEPEEDPREVRKSSAGPKY